MAVGLLVPALVLFIECIAATLPVRPLHVDRAEPRPTVAVLVPAHNEAHVIGTTLDALKRELGEGDRLLVVADNCDDDTAAIARRHGAEVIERREPQLRGKGYALDCGVRQLRASPPQVVIVIDADDIPAPGSFETIARVAHTRGRTVQATAVVGIPPGGSLAFLISAFAFTLKNLVRPRGLQRLGLPCLLGGSGMAFPWPLIRDAPLASGRTAEDLLLSVHLALRSAGVQYCSEANVTSRLHTEPRRAHLQRARWEHGHLETIGAAVPRLLAGFLRQRRPTLLVTLLDLSVPPLSLLALAWGIAFSAAGISFALGGSPVPGVLLIAAALLIASAVGVAWLAFGRGLLPLRAVLGIPVYVLSKVPLYLSFLTRRKSTWGAVTLLALGSRLIA